MVSEDTDCSFLAPGVFIGLRFQFNKGGRRCPMQLLLRKGANAAPSSSLNSLKRPAQAQTKRDFCLTTSKGSCTGGPWLRIIWVGTEVPLPHGSGPLLPGCPPLFRPPSVTVVLFIWALHLMPQKSSAEAQPQRKGACFKEEGVVFLSAVTWCGSINQNHNSMGECRASYRGVNPKVHSQMKKEGRSVPEATQALGMTEKLLASCSEAEEQ